MQNSFFLKLNSLILSLLLCFSSCPIAQAETAAVSLEEELLFPDTQPEGLALTLEDCYKLALIQSEVVAIQKEAISRASAQMFTAASEALGDVDFVVTRNYHEVQKESSTGTFNDPDVSERKFVITQPLFQGFKAVGALTGAGSYKKQQREAWIRAKEILYREVAFAFYSVLRFRKELRIIREVRDLLRDRITELEERERIGRSRPSEIALATTKLKALEAELASAKGSTATAQYLLEYLIGITIQNRKLEEVDSEDLMSKTLDDYLEFVDTRPDVKSAEQAVKVAKSGILVAQSSFWPTVTLDHKQYLRREGYLGNIDWDLLFTIDVPLFSGTATIGQLKDSISVLKQQKLGFSLVKRQAILEIKQSYQGWRYSRDQFLALKEAVASAEENYKLQSEEYRRSLVNNLDVITALESLHNTQQNANRAFYQMKQDEARLKVAIGAFT